MKTLVLLAVALVAVGGLAAWGMQRASGDSATYAVEAIGPDGPVLHATVRVDDATVLRALQAAAHAQKIPLRLEQYPGMGTYVRSIAGHEARGATGWIYEVQHEGAWTSGDRSAEFYPLQKGDSVRWTWTST